MDRGKLRLINCFKWHKVSIRNILMVIAKSNKSFLLKSTNYVFAHYRFLQLVRSIALKRLKGAFLKISKNWIHSGGNWGIVRIVDYQFSKSICLLIICITFLARIKSNLAKYMITLLRNISKKNTSHKWYQLLQDPSQSNRNSWSYSYS